MRMVAPVARPRTVLRVSAPSLLLVSLVFWSAIGCSSASGVLASGDGWSRSYALPYDRVWAAAIASLSSSGYWLGEQDGGRGRIRAESASEPAYRAVVLIVRIDQRGEVVRVGVQASGGGDGAPAEISRLDRVVTEFLDALDDRLRER
jgi:hypothetical protein